MNDVPRMRHRDLLISDRLQAVLTEYGALRSEIHSRSDFESRILQMHVSALTLILGVAMSQQVGVWLVVLIPIESSIAGLWFMVHSLTIIEIGSYIRTRLQPHIQEIVEDDRAFLWETAFRVNAVQEGQSLIARIRVSEWVMNLTFAGPSVVVIITAPLLLALGYSGLGTAFSGLPTHEDPTWWLILFGWLSGLVLFIAYLLLQHERHQLDHTQMTEVGETRP